MVGLRNAGIVGATTFTRNPSTAEAAVEESRYQWPSAASWPGPAQKSIEGEGPNKENL